MAALATHLWRFAAGTQLRRNVLETYGTRLLSVAATFAAAIVIARVLGPTGRGYYAVAVTVGAIGVQFGNLGLHASNTYHVAKDRSLLPSLVGNTLAVVFVSAAVAALLGLVFLVWPQLSPVQGSLLPLALASIPLGLGYLLTQGLLLGVDEVRTYNKIECGGKLLALLLVLLPAFLHRGNISLFFTLTLLATTLSFLWALTRLRSVSHEAPFPSLAVFRKTIGIGMSAYMIAFFGFLVLRIDLLMVKYMLGPTQAGYYSISQILAENTMMFPVVIGLLLFPKLSALKNREEKLQLANKAALATAVLMLPAILLAVWAAAPIISIAFGSSFLPGASAFVWLMPGTYFLGIEIVMVQLLNSEGFPRIIVVAWIIDTIVNVALNLWAIPHFGITGASVVSSISYFLMFLIVSALVWRRNYATQPAIACTPDLDLT